MLLLLLYLLTPKKEGSMTTCQNCFLKDEPEVSYRGNTNAEIVFCFDSPAKNQDKMLTGKYLDIVQDACANSGLDFNSVFLINAARCNIDKNLYTEAKQNKILACCRPKVEQAIDVIKPKLIVCFGAVAFKQMYEKMPLKKARNNFHWSDEFNCWVFCTFHPAAIIREPEKIADFKSDFDSFMQFSKNGYATREQGKWKEVESIRPLLDGGFYKEGDYFVTAIDTETEGVQWYSSTSTIISYQVSKDLNEGWTIVLQEECEKDQGDFNLRVQRGGTKNKPEYIEIGVKKANNYDQKIAELKELLERQDIKKYFFNQKYELHRFMNLGISKWNNCCIDAKTLAHTIDSERFKDCSLADLIDQYTNVDQNHKGDVSDAEKSDMFALLKNDREKFIKYASLDTIYTLQVTLELKKEIMKDQKSLNYFVNFAQPIENDFLFNLERNGVLVDTKKIPEIKERLFAEMDQKEKEFKKLCPPIVYYRHKDNFKLTRTIIMQEALFEWVDKTTKKGQDKPEHHNYGFNLEPIVLSDKTGAPSTDKQQVLGAILDGKYPKKVKELVKLHREWNERRMLLNNFIKNIEKYIDDKDRLHTSYSITFSSSGRVGCIAGGSKVKTVGRDIPIEEVKVGTSVFSFDDNGLPKIKRVTWAGHTGVRKVIRLHFKSTHGVKKSYLDLTPEHKVRIHTGEYVEAQNLKSDQLICAILEEQISNFTTKFITNYGRFTNNVGMSSLENIGKYVTKIEWLNKYVDVYDLEVEDTHNFVVNGVSVHNSRKPNLQNQPKRGDLAKTIRELFIPTKGYKMVHCDYNASELRWVAHVADEKAFAKIFKEGKDPHRITGLEIRGLPENYKFKSEKELKDTRQDSKPVSFGLIYLMSVFGLKRYAKQGYGIEYTDKQAQEKYDRFFRKYYNIPKWHEASKYLLHKNGYLRTVFGRKRTLPKIKSIDKKQQAQAERTGINTLIQGPSSDATLLGGYNLLNDPEVNPNELRIILFIHDAFVFEVAEDKVDHYLPIIKKHMENIPTDIFGFKLKVPLLIEGEVGDRLSELKSVDIPQ